MLYKNIIALCGMKQSGKDYITDQIKDRYPGIVHTLNFGDELKRVAEHVYDFIDFSDPHAPKDTIITTPTFTGTKRDIIFQVDKLKEIDETVFFRMWLKNQFFQVLQKPQHIFIITDMRFEYEYEFLCGQSIPIVRIIRADRSMIVGCEDDIEYEKFLSNIHADHEYINRMHPTKDGEKFHDDIFMKIIKSNKLEYLLH